MPITTMVNGEDPLPCPFCGRAAVVRSWRDEGITTRAKSTWSAVYCDDCDVQMTRCAEPSHTVSLWNRRATVKEHQ